LAIHPLAHPSANLLSGPNDPALFSNLDQGGISSATVANGAVACNLAPRAVLARFSRR
jgi:hypothetical protein